MNTAEQFLTDLNTKYLKLHKTYETYFWDSYMGNKQVAEKKAAAQATLDTFRSSEKVRAQTAEQLTHTKSAALRKRLQVWLDFFDQYRTPVDAQALKKEIDTLESAIHTHLTTRTEGYTDPKTQKFVSASVLRMRTMMRTNAEETTRKACFEALEELAVDNLDRYVELVKKRNQFARLLGHEDFYAYKLQLEEQMSKTELFALFENITQKSTGHFTQIRERAKTTPGLRKPWNFAYKMTGDFTAEEDQYFQFDQALMRWGRSFAALGIDFKDGRLKLDLLDRAGKHNNGFCHWPDLVHFKDGQRVPAATNFTCTVVPDQVGSGIVGYNTLFHEGGHAAHLLNSLQKDVCLNHEYAPMSTAWAETQSMFIDTLFSSPEWKQRYAKNEVGESYPFELYARKERAVNLLKPTGILGIIFVCQFERAVYELENPTADKIQKLARTLHRTYFDQDGDSLWALQIPHIYSWESACGYQGYGLAQVALAQWREYFYKKYGFIVDNTRVGKEMTKTWQWGASKSFPEAIKQATGKKLSSTAFIKEINLSAEQVIRRAKKRIAVVEQQPVSQKPVDLQATITMVHGTKKIADNKQSFEEMAQKYERWIKKQTS